MKNFEWYSDASSRNFELATKSATKKRAVREAARLRRLGADEEWIRRVVPHLPKDEGGGPMASSYTIPKKAKTLCGVELSSPAETEIAERNLALTREHYWVRRLWDRRSPVGEDADFEHWTDHPYRLIPRKGGQTIDVSEPYGLTEDDFRRFLELEEEGWRAWIGQTPLWFPGRTTPVCLRREGRA